MATYGSAIPVWGPIGCTVATAGCIALLKNESSPSTCDFEQIASDANDIFYDVVGKCNSSCPTGQACEGYIFGTCKCPQGQILCNGACRATDCPEAGNQCDGPETFNPQTCTCESGPPITCAVQGQTCDSATGICACSIGYGVCGPAPGACTNITVGDPNNCGGCGDPSTRQNICADGASCVAFGQCRCPPNEVVCGNVCSFGTVADDSKCPAEQACFAEQGCHAKHPPMITSFTCNGDTTCVVQYGDVATFSGTYEDIDGDASSVHARAVAGSHVLFDGTRPISPAKGSGSLDIPVTEQCALPLSDGCCGPSSWVVTATVSDLRGLTSPPVQVSGSNPDTCPSGQVCSSKRDCCPPGGWIDCGSESGIVGGPCCAPDSICGDQGQCCPSEFPVDCGSGTGVCCPSDSMCGDKGECCSSGFPVDCGSGLGFCCPSDYVCVQEGCCPSEAPFYCGSGVCARNGSECPRDRRRAQGPAADGDGSDGASVRRLVVAGAVASGRGSVGSGAAGGGQSSARPSAR